MKILHVIPSISPLRGGPSLVLQTIASGLAARGVDVHLAMTDDNGPGRLSVPLGQPVYENGVTRWYFPRHTRFYTVSIDITKWLWSHVAEFDLVHIHALFSYCSNVAAWIAKRKNVPYLIRPLGVLNVWGMQNRRPWLKRQSFRFIESGLLANACAIHYTSEDERAQAEHLGIRQPALVIPNPVEAPPHSPEEFRGEFRARFPELSNNRKLVLFLSRIDRKKGLDILIPAFADVRSHHPDAVLVVGGSGEPAFVESLKLLATRADLNTAIIWTGFLSGREKWAAFADADLFVLPSYSENFGVAVVEAMSFGVPVLVSDQVAIHREISEAGAGIIVPARRDSLAEGLDRLLIDSELRAVLAERSSHLANTKFSIDVVIEQLMHAYRELLLERPPSSGQRAVRGQMNYQATHAD